MICPIAQDLAAHSKYVLVMHPQLSAFFRCVAGLNASPGFFFAAALLDCEISSYAAQRFFSAFLFVFLDDLFPGTRPRSHFMICTAFVFSPWSSQTEC